MKQPRGAGDMAIHICGAAAIPPAGIVIHQIASTAIKDEANIVARDA